MKRMGREFVVHHPKRVDIEERRLQSKKKRDNVRIPNSKKTVMRARMGFLLTRKDKYEGKDLTVLQGYLRGII